MNTIRLTTRLGLLSLLIILLCGCIEERKEEQSNTPGETAAITITANSLSDFGTTWDSQDKIAVIENNMTLAIASVSELKSDGHVEFTVAMAKDSTSSGFCYDAIYPAEAISASYEGGGIVVATLNSEQRPQRDSFDRESFIMVAERVTAQNQPSQIDMHFSPIVAVGVLQLSGLGKEQTVNEICIEACGAEDRDISLAGQMEIDFTKSGKVKYVSSDVAPAISLKIEDTIDTTTPILFCCHPCELRAGDNLRIEVDTDENRYSSTITIADGQSIAFKAGHTTPIAAHFSAILPPEDNDDGDKDGEDKEDKEDIDGHIFRRVGSVTSGKGYLIVANDCIATPLTKDYGYLPAEVTTEYSDGVIVLDDTDYAFVVDSKDGAYTLRQAYDGRYLYQFGRHNSFNASDTPAEGELWSIESRGDNSFKITNTSVNKYIQYNGQYTSFGSYATLQDEGIYPMLYEYDGQITIEERPDDDPVVPPTPTDKSDWFELPADKCAVNYPEAVTITVWDGDDRNYTHFYDVDTYTSLWVAYPLESRHMGSYSRPGSWSWNPHLSTDIQVNLCSHSYAGDYSRGHLIPNASRNGIRNMQLQTFYVTNSVPQIQGGFNGGIWQKLEASIQSEAESDMLYVVTGVAFNKVGESKTIKYTKAKDDTKDVPVPNYFYKVVLKVKYNDTGEVCDAQSVGFWFEHSTYSDSYTNYSVSVDDIEAWTGFDYFAALPDSVEATAEKNTSWSKFTTF